MLYLINANPCPPPCYWTNPPPGVNCDCGEGIPIDYPMVAMLIIIITCIAVIIYNKKRN